MKTVTISLATLFCGYFFITHSNSNNHELKGDFNAYVNQMDKDNAIAYAPAKVDYDAFEKLVAEVKMHRQKRLVGLDEFLNMSKGENTIILDTRSDKMYEAKHVKGAVHLSFPDFTQNNLDDLIGDKNTRILIYCNNNFGGDELYLPTKTAGPVLTKVSNEPAKELTLALNIPTYINLYGYGFKNVYELAEFVDVKDSRIVFEGTAVRK
ncbi:MAG TPA: rhodanese-like domain-containing protein [Flavobacteriales bacterium]|nr:rhodanese-like domain-containing protein [Flavobacteriales bacterium]